MKTGRVLHSSPNSVNITKRSIFVALDWLLAKTCSTRSDPSGHAHARLSGHHSGGSKTMWERHMLGFNFRV